MKQARIKALLIEASQPACPEGRRVAIQGLLGRELPKDPDDDARMEGLSLVFSQLYDSARRHRPDLLLSLFPVFAILCGDRDEGSVVCDVEWSLV